MTTQNIVNFTGKNRKDMILTFFKGFVHYGDKFIKKYYHQAFVFKETIDEKRQSIVLRET